MLIIDKCGGDVEKALFYVRKTVENGWSRNVLAIEIAGDLYSRQGKAVTNFALTMPEPCARHFSSTSFATRTT